MATDGVPAGVRAQFEADLDAYAAEWEASLRRALAGDPDAPFAFDPDEPRDEKGRWAAGGRAATVAAAFDALPDEGPYARTPPFPVEEADYSGSDSLRGDVLLRAPVQEVPLAALVAQQSTVRRDSVVYAAEHPGEPILVVRFGGRLYVDNGTHRATAALLAGDDVIAARVFDYDPKTRRFTPVPRGGLGG